MSRVRFPNRARLVSPERCRALNDVERCVEICNPLGCDNCCRPVERVVTWWELGAVGVDEVQVMLCLACSRHFMDRR